MRLFETITDLGQGERALRRRRYGVIETARGRLIGVHLRPWPKRVSHFEARWLGGRFHRLSGDDRCFVYYNQPLGHSRFLALTYAVSGSGCTLATLHAAAGALDAVARIKQSDAALCHVTSGRISDRLLARFGWSPHCLSSRGRHFIKRY
ncbi:MAG: hypothetical protein KDA41_09815 [Planctomycetales bacterium]|nr:hypothetical protein [Planctomycetales bacterium]